MSDFAARDLDAYLDALPRRTLLPPRTPPIRFRTTNWPLLRPYNGFSGIERRRGGQLSSWLVDAGSMIVPDTCDVCGSKDRVNLHGESYYHVNRAPALCNVCHRAIHRRWFDDAAWHWLASHRGKSPHLWLDLLSRHPLDLAAHIRQTHGWAAANVLADATLLTVASAIKWPNNLMPHPMGSLWRDGHRQTGLLL